MDKKILGIIGGMGPAATVDMMDKIVRHTDASADGEHVRVLIDVNTTIPDRSASIKGTGANCIAAICDSAVRLAKAGADYLMLACNTSHYYLPEIQKSVSVPFISMVDATVEYALAHRFGSVALLASDGTWLGAVYDRPLEQAGVTVVRPTPEEQQIVMKAIYDVKAYGADRTDTAALNGVIRSFCARGAKAVILACTEFPLLTDRMIDAIPYVDATEILVKKAIAVAGYPVK